MTLDSLRSVLPIPDRVYAKLVTNDTRIRIRHSPRSSRRHGFVILLAVGVLAGCSSSSDDSSDTAPDSTTRSPGQASASVDQAIREGEFTGLGCRSTHDWCR